MSVRPLRENAPPHQWECTNCGARTIDPPIQPTLDPRYRTGYCLTCRGQTTWKRIDG